MTNSTSKGLPTSTSFSSTSPPAWLWQSMKPGHDGHLPRVERLRVLAGEPLDVVVRADGDEPAGFHRERLGSRHPRIHRVDLRVDHDEVRVAGLRGRRGHRGAAEPRRRRRRQRARAGHSHESPARLPLAHRLSHPTPWARATGATSTPGKAALSRSDSCRDTFAPRRAAAAADS